VAVRAIDGCAWGQRSLFVLSQNSPAEPAPVLIFALERAVAEEVARSVSRASEFFTVVTHRHPPPLLLIVNHADADVVDPWDVPSVARAFMAALSPGRASTEAANGNSVDSNGNAGNDPAETEVMTQILTDLGKGLPRRLVEPIAHELQIPSEVTGRVRGVLTLPSQCYIETCAKRIVDGFANLPSLGALERFAIRAFRGVFERSMESAAEAARELWFQAAWTQATMDWNTQSRAECLARFESRFDNQIWFSEVADFVKHLRALEASSH
jgi:hypothetical protein